MFSSQNLKEQALSLGFNMVGIVRAEPSPTLDAYRRWLAQGMNADMAFMGRIDRVRRREDLNQILPNVQSMVVVGVDYLTDRVASDILNDPSRGRIANYAWALDYHHVLTPRLMELATWIQHEARHEFAVYVDTGAVLERSHAQQAGLGFVGKNTMLIHPRRGSYFFIGEFLTTLEFDQYDVPHRASMCGACTRCMQACPTDAFPQPYVLDARLCISYHTIENRTTIPVELRSRFGNWIYGCDVCQEVCPFQRFSLPTHELAFYPTDLSRVAPLLRDVLQTTPNDFAQQFSGSPIVRVKRERWVRNACIASGNSRDKSLVSLLEALLRDESDIVRDHASWALDQLLSN